MFRRFSRSSGSKRSILFQTSRMRCPASGSMPSWRSTVSTSRCCASASSWEMSRTWRMTSASSTSSSVARNAATSCVGRLEMNPTVSESIALPPCGRLSARKVGSSVANSMSAACHIGAGQPIEQRRFAGVGIADQRHHAIRHPFSAGAMQPPRRLDFRQFVLEAARCDRRSGGDRPRSGFRRGRP